MEEPRRNRRYVLVTPARNEAATIGEVIASVARQSLSPAQWIIVSDGSTDETDRIVAEAAERHPWIALKRRPVRDQHCFASVVEATEFGISCLTCEDFAYLGLLDADVRFQPDYFEEVIRRFEADRSLGMGGGVVIDVGEPKDRLPRNRMDIPGAVQFFRRDCYESLGGLVAIPEGGWDTVTCAQARMNGFRTELFTDLVVEHLKPRNVSRGGALRRKWQMGVRDFAVGYRAAFEAVKCLGRMGERPWVAGAFARWLGFLTASVRGVPRRIPEDLLAFLRAEQGRRIREAFFGRAAASNQTHE